MKRIEIGVLRSRDAHKIRGHLLMRGLSLVGLAREIGVSKQLVQATVRGEKHSSYVLNKLREYGVPEELLHDPKRIKSAYSASELASILSMTIRAIQLRARREDWESRSRIGRGGGREFLLNALPKGIQEKVMASMDKAE